jgi:N utilization substance protein A
VTCLFLDIIIEKGKIMDLSNARSEFAAALRHVCSERGIDPQSVIEALEQALLAAYRKEKGIEVLEESYRVDIDSETGEIHVFNNEEDVTPSGFGRIASQTAKQVVLQRIREAEKQAIIKAFEDKVGTVQSGMVQRYEGQTVVIDLGLTEAYMLRSEQVFRERYRLNQRYLFYITEIANTEKGPRVMVSRTREELVKEIFAREVPEVANGSVEVVNLVREPGVRTKLSVKATAQGIDPVGTCVGQKGVRVQAVILALGGDERVDVIAHTDDQAKLIAAALAPAKGLLVNLDKDTKAAQVICPVDQLSLAIGRAGHNVRLAAKLTGWHIDIKPPAGAELSEDAQKAIDEMRAEESVENDTSEAVVEN